MTGDYTRFTFKPKKDYSSVLKQQGRVDLDADFNELIEIVDRRWRAETIDIIGDCTVPNTTPDAFLVTPTALGDFDIGIGRMYVDGIQVENHGLPPDQYLPDLGELRGTLPVPYSNQPYLPSPLPPPLTAGAGTTDLVYIDVWQREVTALGDPALREIALGGPDTATRVQAVWQVRALQGIGPHSCGDDITRWDDLVAPSAGRLTTSTVPPPASDDPCIIAPTGGYRGLENRLYRVEIHSIGPIGGAAPAKFKWSRNNASVASRVSAIPSPTDVTVELIGRDQVLRFEIGNWIEITDDFREFQGLAGHMTQITKIDEANRILTFAPAIPGGFNFNAADPARHTRVVRWDQSQNVDANGLLDVAAGPIDIEDGIRVTFALDPTTGNFKIGDFWVFAARTADGSVEVLDDAPPRGILHHFCRLGFINWGATLAATTFTNCRNHWPPADCDCCTVTVGDGIDSHGQFSDIQQAIDSLGDRGGLVCIGRGFYRVTETIRLVAKKRNVTIRGMGPATRIAFVPDGNSPGVFMQIVLTDHVRLEDVLVVAANAAALVQISASQFCRVTNCVLINVPGESLQTAPRAIDLVENSGHCEIVHNAMIAAKAVASTGRVADLLVRDNQTLCTQVAVGLLQARGVEIVHNQFRGLPQNAFPASFALTRETIDEIQTKVSNLFLAAGTASNFQAAGVLIYSGNRVVISENLITAQVAVLGFLLIDARIERNDILSLVGILSIFALLQKVEDNFVLGLFAGMIQAGIAAVVDCTSNEWLGLHGILWMSLVELLNSIGKLLAGALSAVGFGKGLETVTGTITNGTGLSGDAKGFGMVAMAKIHRNDFLTFSRGIYKTDAVLSADVSIIDNSFMLCSHAGIELGGSPRAAEKLAPFLVSFLSVRHLIQANGLAVTGTGIITATPATLIEQNNVQCPSVAVKINARFCTVKNNLILGVAAAPVTGAGLISLFSGARDLEIAGNRILNASGHSVLFLNGGSDVTIADNLIRGANFTAIGTLSDALRVLRLNVSRNRIEQCNGDVPDIGKFQFSGAVAVGDAVDVRLLDNTIADNSPAASSTTDWFAVVFADVDGIEIRGNRITGNATVAAPGLSPGAIGLPGVSGTVTVQHNVVRGNGGAAVRIQGSSQTSQVARVMVQNNHFSDGPNPDVFLVFITRVDSLVFEGNQCFSSPAPQGVFRIDIELTALAQANVSANSVQSSGALGMFVMGNRLLVNGNSVQSPGKLALQATPIGAGAALILTSNLTTGFTPTPPSTSPNIVVANNLP
ncbi:MAG TPA: DUF6519 domain-containing protein [Candidatus Acidoferrales bacterium]|jgi:hypothetical protein|nr:DUF6519 domain-containing protein [Candidatus Acidoferrales bacterium]